MRFSSARAPRSSGFTLVELLSVLIILGLLGAIAAPRLFDNRIFGARGYADELASSLRYSQRIAIASGCNVRFAATTSGYSATQRSAYATCRSAGTWSQPVRLPDGSALTGTAPAGVAASAAVVEFDSAGRPTTAVAPLSVGAFTITIDALTGTVVVQ